MARTLGLFLMLASTTLASAAFAEASEDELRQRDDTIAELVRKVDVLTDEVSTLRTQVAVPEEAELKSAYGFGPAASRVYGMRRGLSIGGYGEANYINHIGGEDDEDLDRADALRTVLYLGYKFSESIVFNSEIEFEHASTELVNNGEDGGSVSVEFAALDFMWRPELNARAGLLLIPMGFINEVHEPPFFYGVQRPEVERRILPSTWRENGVGVFGQLGESLEYRAYALNGFNAQNFSDAGIRDGRQNGSQALAEDFAFVTRLDWTPDAVPGFLLGGAFYVGDSGQDVELDPGGDVPAARLWIFEGHAQYQNGPFHARGLFAFSSLSDARELSEVLLAHDADFEGPVADEMLGGYAEVAYDVYPSLFGSEDKQLEPFARVEYVDTQYDVPSGFTPNRDQAFWLYAGGLNFYPHPNVVLKLEYRNYDTRGDGSRADELGLGMGFAF
jgi:opacity protein-like surface antigen